MGLFFIQFNSFTVNVDRLRLSGKPVEINRKTKKEKV